MSTVKAPLSRGIRASTSSAVVPDVQARCRSDLVTYLAGGQGAGVDRSVIEPSGIVSPSGARPGDGRGLVGVRQGGEQSERRGLADPALPVTTSAQARPG